ncbi:GNAT family N-acetyltransferase [Microbacterium gorillae]|uniref:GNAT family N-acetyltransferase n=1 Tax=Microbacterium gorillae TaxID=1231063 RepID=UPI00058EDC86|nr:GNAT family N-acetyltransferase [Microbacterium gorillae]
MIRLVLPDRSRRDSWLDAIAEFGGDTLHGFSLFGHEDADLSDDAAFERWRAREEAQRTVGQDGFVPATVWWIVDDTEPDIVLGSMHLRHELNDFLLAEGGHIGYAVRPSARGRGVATAALAACLDEARGMGLDRVLLICDADNAGSRATIRRAGGVPENGPGTIERFWITL